MATLRVAACIQCSPGRGMSCNETPVYGQRQVALHCNLEVFIAATSQRPVVDPRDELSFESDSTSGLDDCIWTSAVAQLFDYSTSNQT